MDNILLKPKNYAKITGVALAATALLGIVMEIVNHGKFLSGFLAFDWTHDILHVVLAAAALGAGFLVGGSYARTYAIVFGFVYTALAVVGFVKGDILNGIGLNLELGENLIHVVIGLWGITAGFLGTHTATSKPTGARGA